MDLNKSSNTVLAVFWSRAAKSECIALIGVAFSVASACSESECRSDSSCWANFSLAFFQLQKPPLANELQPWQHPLPALLGPKDFKDQKRHKESSWLSAVELYLPANKNIFFK